MEEVLEEIKKKVRENTVICFDMFDTLVARSCYPDYTKEAWAIHLSSLLDQPEKAEDFIAQRFSIEKSIAEKNQSIHGESEYRHQEIAEAFYDYCHPEMSKSAFVELCTRLEVSIEKKVQHVKPGVLDVLKYCKKERRTIICLSDMYLSKDMISDILKFHGLREYFDDIIVSNEVYKTKRSGALYGYVKEVYKNAKYLMLGNDYNADFKNALSQGFEAIHIDSSLSDYFYSQLKGTTYNKPKYLEKVRLFVRDEDNETCQNEYRLYTFCKTVQEQLFLSNTKSFSIESPEKDLLLKRLAIAENEEWLYLEDVKKSHFTIKITHEDATGLALALLKNDTEITSVEIDTNKLNLSTYTRLVSLVANRDLSEPEIFNDLRPAKELKPIKVSEIKKQKLQKVGQGYATTFYNFAKWIKERCQKEKIKKVYFFTREGEFFKELFDLVNDGDIKADVLEVSRLATLCPSIRAVTTDECMRFWNQYSTQSMRAFCTTMALEASELAPLFSKYHISLSEEIIYPWQDSRIKALFNDQEFVSYVESQISKKQKTILEYFAAHGLKNTKEKIAIVDIGWRGTIQDNVCYLLDKTHIIGYYFGLENFLNVQPENSEKYGFINRFKGCQKIINKVTPLEMICNSPNGSTVGYTSDPEVSAIRKNDPKEDQSFYSCTKYIQQGIIQEISTNHSIPTDDLAVFNNVVDLVFEPNKYIAKTYFKLKHNEEFGTGDFALQKRSFHYEWALMGVISGKHRAMFIQNILNSSWPQGLLAVNHCTFINRHRKKKNIDAEVDSCTNSNGKTIAWVLPYVIPGSGGHRTIIQNANALAKNGYIVDLYVEDDYVTSDIQMKNRIKELFGECLCEVHMGYEFRRPYDLAIATYSETTVEIVEHSNAKVKANFIQDYEPWFVPMGGAHIKMEQVYRKDLKNICIGRWLASKVSSEFGSNAVKYFPFCADTNVYKKFDVEKEPAVCFIYQPEKPRRCWELGIRALHIVKTLHPEVTIYLYGSPSDCAANFEHQNMHILSPTECNELYNKCKVGLCLSASNPSRIPFEMMAAGLPVVDLYRENNVYDMPSEGVLLAESTPESIATSIIKVLEDESLAKSMSKYGSNYMKDYPLSRGFDDFLSAIATMLDGSDYTGATGIKKLYDKKPLPISTEVAGCRNLTPFEAPGISKKEKLKRRLKHLRSAILRRIKAIIKL
ncbi:hypothetical protein J6D24_00220 [Candidatus Saccharibacteria bacterium]|nr:hypothetical protein [Candidatus Saccharibacteria bacterium]